MSFFPFWLGGVALATIALIHCLVFRTSLAVSGRLTAIVNAVRDRVTGVSDDDASPEDLAAALRAMTAAEFGDAALDAMPAADEPAAPPSPTEFTPGQHALFFVGLVLGGLAVSLATGSFHVTSLLEGPGFASMIGTGPRAALALFVGGTLVGFGTRMSGGCTSGHGLVGVSRLSVSSLAATAGFFGAGIGFSFLLEVLR